MTSTGSAYYDQLRASGKNLADTVKQASRRARLYALEDNGASDLAHRKRALRESIAARRAIIYRIEQRQAGALDLPPLPRETAERYLAAHRKAITGLKEKLASVSPSVPVIAPMTRRVAREDRRRTRRTKTAERKQ